MTSARIDPYRGPKLIITDYLNIRNSTRQLSDDEFDSLLPILAKELSSIDVVPVHTDTNLIKDWKKLLEWTNEETTISSTNRVGMKLCDHFFPNFYDIKDDKGRSFQDLWGDTKLLEKILRWNRKSHSTPYLSELKRGIYFCGGLAKSTMYRPQMAKMVTRGSNIVLDPCCGWGGRMLGAVANGAEYYGFEPNTQTYDGLNRLAEFLNIEDKVHIYCDDALNMNDYDIPLVDCVLTSPPYFTLEVYTDEDTQSVTGMDTYADWSSHFFRPLISMCLDKLKTEGKSCWNVAKIKQFDMWSDVQEVHEDAGFSLVDTFSVASSKRQVNGKGKSLDETRVFQR